MNYHELMPEAKNYLRCFSGSIYDVILFREANRFNSSRVKALVICKGTATSVYNTFVRNLCFSHLGIDELNKNDNGKDKSFSYSKKEFVPWDCVNDWSTKHLMIQSPYGNFVTLEKLLKLKKPLTRVMNIDA